MTPQEQELILKVVQRVQQAPAQTKDPQAEQLIHDQLAQYPDALYLLTQAVIIQEQGLLQAQQQIRGLQTELQQARTAPAPQGGGFLGGMFGGTPSGVAANPTPAMPLTGAGTSSGFSPGVKPGGKPGTTANAAGKGPQPKAAAGNVAAGANRSGMGDFMRNAAMMAVGVAGGQMLYSGLQGMFSDEPGDAAAADATAAETTATDAADPVADSGGWGADQGVSDQALSGDDPSLWEQPEPAAEDWTDASADEPSPELDTGADDAGFGDDFGDDFGGGDDEWG